MCATRHEPTHAPHGTLLALPVARGAARKAAEAGDDGTNDLLVSGVIRTHEIQVWFLAEHPVDTLLVRAE